MRAATKAYADRVTRGARTQLEVTSWLGTSRLGQIPVVPGSWAVEDAADQQVPGSIRFDVPNQAKWRPVGPRHPLAAMGQQVQARIGIHVGNGFEWLPLGRFRLNAPEPSGDVLQVTGTGLLVNVERARLLSPFRAASGSTRGTALQKLLGGIIPWRMAGVTDEKMGAFVCERERLEGLREIVDAWPARLEMSDTGILLIRPTWNDDSPGSVVKEIVDGPGGTLVSCQPKPDTSSMFNGYAVSTAPEGDAQPVTETWVQPTGPMAWTGAYGQFPGFFASPTLTNDRKKLRALAATMTRRAIRRRDAYEVTSLPDARVQVGDVVRVRSASVGVDITGRVTRLTHTRTSLTCTVAYMSGDRP